MKLFATSFSYTVDGPTYRQAETHIGSYLGRKPATRQTVRRFLRRNAKLTGLPLARYTELRIIGTEVSPWRFPF